MGLRNVNSILDDASGQIITQLTPKLRNMASDAGWPIEIVQSLTLIYSGGHIVVDYPKELSSQIEDLEYGTVGTPPNSVIRTFSLRYETEAYKFITDLIGEDFYTHGGGW